MKCYKKACCVWSQLGSSHADPILLALHECNISTAGIWGKLSIFSYGLTTNAIPSVGQLFFGTIPLLHIQLWTTYGSWYSETWGEVGQVKDLFLTLPPEIYWSPSEIHWVATIALISTLPEFDTDTWHTQRKELPVNELRLTVWPAVIQNFLEGFKQYVDPFFPLPSAVSVWFFFKYNCCQNLLIS